MIRTLGRWSCALAAMATVLLASDRASAQIWVGPLSGTTNWSAGFWVPSPPPPGGNPSIFLNFSQIGTGSYTANNDLGNPFVLAGLEYTSFGGSITVGNVTGNSFEFNNGAGPAFIRLPALGNHVFTTTTASNITVPVLNILQSSGFGSLRIASTLAGSATLEINALTPTNITNFVDLINANTFTGGVILNSGNLRIGNATALGTGSLTVNGGSLATTAATTIANNIVLNGSDLLATGSLTVDGVISETSTPRAVRFEPTATTVTLTLRNANTYTGSTLVGINPLMSANGPVSGNLTLSGANGSILSSPLIEINTGTLTINSATAGENNNNRIGNSATIRSIGGTVLLTGGASTSTLEDVGPLNFSGSTFVTINAGTTGNTGTVLQADSLGRINRGQILFRANNASFGGPLAANVAQMLFDVAPALVGGGGGPGSPNISIIPFAIGGIAVTSLGTDLVTYGPNGVRPLSLAAGEYATSVADGATTTNNLRLAATNPVIDSPTTVNALVVATATPFAGTSTGTLTLTAGTLLNTTAFTLPSTMTLDFGSAEAAIFNTAAMTVAGSITGTNGLSKTGTSNLILSNPAGVNVTGTLTINQGGVEFTDAAALNSFSQIEMNGRSSTTTPGLVLGSTATTSQTVNKTIISHEGFGRFTNSSTTTGVFLVIAGQLTGPGGFILTGGNIELTNTANNFQGQFRFFSGNLRFGSDAVFGNAPSIDIGTVATTGVILTGNWTTNRPINFSFSSQLDTNGFDMVMNGTITGTASTLNKIGLGRWEISSHGSLGMSTTSGTLPTATTINVNAGELRVTNTTGSATGIATVNIGTPTLSARLSGTGRMAGAVTVAAPSFIEPGLGGTTQATLSFDGNLTLNGTYEVDADLAGGVDKIYIRGNLVLGTASVIDFKNPANYNPLISYTVAEFDGTLTGSFATLVNLPPTHTLQYLTNSIVLVPEPASMLGVGALGVLALLRRKRLARQV